MPDSKGHSLYNIDPLKPLIDEGFCLLTPNFRLARRIKTVWDSVQVQAGTKAWTPLQLMPLETWLSRRWQTAVELGLVAPGILIDEGQALELWQQVIAQHQNSSDTYSLLRPSAAAALASAARESLTRWQVAMDAPSIRQEFELDEDCATYLAWQDLFQQRLDREGMVTSADSIRQLLGVSGEMPVGPLALLDFDDVPPLYQACMDASSPRVLKLEPGAEPGQKIAHAFADKRSELLAAAQWAKQHSDLDPDAKVAIILPNMSRDRPAMEYLLRREYSCLGQNYHALPVNFSAGVALDRVPVVRDGLRALNLSQQKVAVPEVVAILQSRFLNLPDATSAVAVKFIRGLFNDGIEEIDIAALRNMACQVKLGDQKGLVVGERLMALSRMRELAKKHLPSQWVELLSSILDTWGWPGQGALDSLEYQQVEMWYELLDGFAAYDAVCGVLSLDAALQLLTRCASRQVFQPQTPDSPIQVLGILEGAGLEFDQLWICGLQGSSWPAPARPSPVIPLSLQRTLQMPHATAEREWLFARGLMDRYLRSARQIHASYVQLLDGVPELPSALLDGFDTPDDRAPENTLDPSWTRQHDQFALEAVEENTAPAISAAEADRLGGGSGLLEDQSHCPFRAFARRRLNVQPLGDFQVGLSAATRGSILHDALYSLWGAIGDSGTLASMNEDSLTSAIFEASGAALQSIPSRIKIAFGQAYLTLEGRRLASVLHEWVLVEKQREEFSVQATELDITLNMAPLEIRLRVDRIDQMPDGSQVIIDYKSGRCAVGDWLGERPAKPQLLLYGIAASSAETPQPVSALCFAQVRPRDCAYVGAGQVEAAPGVRTDIVKLVGDKHAVDDWAGLNRAWRDILEQLVAEFAAGNAEVDPLSRSSCTYCGLQPLCRIDEETGVEQ